MNYIVIMLSALLFSQGNARYKVYKISVVQSYYVVYCERDGRQYKIVSKAQRDKGPTIKVGGSYDLRLTPLADKKTDQNPLTNKLPNVIGCYMFTDTKICEEAGIKLYTTKDLKGLHYSKTAASD